GVALLALLALGTFGTTPQALAQKPGGNETGAKKVTLNLENADLRYALKLLFQNASANYTLDQAVQGTVTVSLTDVSFRTALESVLRSTQSQAPLTYRVEDGVYIISPKVEQVEDKTASSDENGVNAAAKKTRPVKIQINFADAIDISQALGGGVVTSRM